jgi:hypothetical protein
MNTATSTEATQTAKLETETCSRCGGSGHHSYCQMYGTRSFKCGGVGRTYTKRGRAARTYLEQLRSKRACELAAGDVVHYAGVSGAWWITLTEVGVSTMRSSTLIGGVWVPRDNSDLIDYVGARKDGELCSMSWLPRDHRVRVAQTAEQKAATYAQAVAYQATLTKSGTPRKRAA